MWRPAWKREIYGERGHLNERRTTSIDSIVPKNSGIRGEGSPKAGVHGKRDRRWPLDGDQSRTKKFQNRKIQVFHAYGCIPKSRNKMGIRKRLIILQRN